MLTNIKKHRSLSKLRKSTVSAVVAVSVLGAGLAMKSVDASNTDHAAMYTKVIQRLESEKKGLLQQLENVRDVAARDFEYSEKLLKSNGELCEQLEEKSKEVDELSEKLQAKSANYQSLSEIFAMKELESENYKLTMSSILEDKDGKIDELQNEVYRLQVKYYEKTPEEIESLKAK